MLLKAFITVLALTAALGSAAADGSARPHRERLIRGRRVPHVIKLVRVPELVPDCRENWGETLVTCAPRVYLDEPYSLQTLALLKGPPRRVGKPYPSLFSWPYGAQ